MKYCLWGFLLTGWVSQLAAADVIPTRSRTEIASAPVRQSLESMGVSRQDAAQQVRDMSSRDLEYFSSDSRRIRLAAGKPNGTWLDVVIEIGTPIVHSGLILTGIISPF